MVPGFVLKVSRKCCAFSFSMFIFNLLGRAFLKKKKESVANFIIEWLGVRILNFIHSFIQ